jgi:hypothetical protein
MATTIQPFSLPEDPQFLKLDQDISAAGDSAAIRLCNEVVIQIGGSATAINATPLRSPDGAADNYAPAGEDITGDPSDGIQIKRYVEPSVGYWKLRVNSITGTAKIHISGSSGS